MVSVEIITRDELFPHSDRSTVEFSFRAFVFREGKVLRFLKKNTRRRVRVYLIVSKRNQANFNINGTV